MQYITPGMKKQVKYIWIVSETKKVKGEGDFVGDLQS